LPELVLGESPPVVEPPDEPVLIWSDMAAMPGEVLAVEVVGEVVARDLALRVLAEGVEGLAVVGDLLGAVGPRDHRQPADAGHGRGGTGARLERLPERQAAVHAQHLAVRLLLGRVQRRPALVGRCS
jgi:hypothetical protein